MGWGGWGGGTYHEGVVCGVEGWSVGEGGRRVEWGEKIMRSEERERNSGERGDGDVGGVVCG